MGLPAWEGNDVIRNKEWKPVLKGLNGWSAYVKREAKRKSKKGKLNWTGFVMYVESRSAYRISFASQPYNILTGN